MRVTFFGKPGLNPEINEHLIIYILSLLNPDARKNAALVSRDWNKYIAFTRKYISLLPTIHQIPFLKGLGLDVIRLKILSGGMTNSSYILKTLGQKWVLRIPGAGSSSFLKRADEAYNLHQAEKLGLIIPSGFSDPQTGLLLTPFIEGMVLDENALARKEILKHIADLMHTLHTSEPFENSVNIFERHEMLIDNLKHESFSFPMDIEFIEKEMEYLKKLFSFYQFDLRPCHNDTTPLNWIVAKDKKEGVDGGEKELATPSIYMIDWEYSSNNDFLWDLVYFAVEAKLSVEQQYDLLTFYFGENQVSQSVLAWFEVYKPIVEWWITAWYWTQLANKANAADSAVYKRSGEICCKTTLAFLKSEAYQNAIKYIEEESASPIFSGSRTFSC